VKLPALTAGGENGPKASQVVKTVWAKIAPGLAEVGGELVVVGKDGLGRDGQANPISGVYMGGSKNRGKPQNGWVYNGKPY